MKKFISFILVIAIVVSMVCIGTISVCATSFTSTGGVLGAGSYVLEDDVVLTSSIEILEGTEVTIDLNGHVLQGNDTLVISNSGILTVIDSNTEAENYFEYDRDSNHGWKATNSSIDAISISQIILQF